MSYKCLILILSLNLITSLLELHQNKYYGYV